jgi:tetrathionate reductase subunit A
MTKSRTISNYWLTSVLPENALLINRRDAERLGLREGDKVRVRSASNPDGMWDLGNDRRLPLELKVKVVEGIRPGTVTFALGFGHWAYGASEIVIDGQRIPADPRRAKGVHLNAAGIALRELVPGTQLRIGSTVILEVTQVGKECTTPCTIAYLAGECVMPREGIFARVIVGGVVRVGDEIRVEHAQRASVRSTV